MRPELEKVRAICLALAGAEERLSHGTPAWFVKGKQFAHYWDNHHEDGRLAIWCAAPLGMKETLTQADAERFFVPPYVGHRGWLGVNLADNPDWAEIEHILTYAHKVVLPSTRRGRDRQDPSTG